MQKSWIVIISQLLLISHTSIGQSQKNERIIVADASVEGMEARFGSLTNKIISTQWFDSADYRRLILSIGYFCEEKLEAAEMDERESVVRELFGEDGYKLIGEILVRQLASDDRKLRISALKGLGKLYSSASEVALRNAVFSSEAYEQFFAMVSLVGIGSPGTDKLLMNMVLSGTLPDILVPEAINALVLANKEMVADFVPEIMNRNQSSTAIRAMFPAIKARGDHREIITILFLRTKVELSESGKFDLEQMNALNLTSDLLREIDADYAFYLKDQKIVERLEEYARSDNMRLYVPSLLLFENSGRDARYFEGLLKGDEVSEEKSRFLKVITERLTKMKGSTKVPVL